MASHLLKKTTSLQSTGAESGEKTSVKMETVMNETTVSTVTETPVFSNSNPPEIEASVIQAPPEAAVIPTATVVTEQFNSMTSETVTAMPPPQIPVSERTEGMRTAPVRSAFPPNAPATANVPAAPTLNPQAEKTGSVPATFNSDDPHEKFTHLTPEEYIKIFNCTKEEFDAKKPWQQERERKKNHLW
jgi:hypothetical protein